jgi:hypothetical protein
LDRLAGWLEALAAMVDTRPICALWYTYSSRQVAIMPVMPTKKNGRGRVPPIVAAVVRPVSIHLSRMEDLLIEMRAEQDVKLKKINKLQQQFDELAKTVKGRFISSRSVTRMTRHH